MSILIAARGAAILVGDPHALARVHNGAGWGPPVKAQSALARGYWRDPVPGTRIPDGFLDPNPPKSALHLALEGGVLEFIEEEHPRDQDGKFTSSGDSGGGEAGPASEHGPQPIVLTRAEEDDPSGGPDPEVARANMEYAEGYDDGADSYYYSDDYMPYLGDPDEAYANSGNEPAPPDHWEPGSGPALSESASMWQRSFDDSRQIAIAADGLRGYTSQDGRRGTIGDEQYARARELLNAMASDDLPPARSAYTIDDEYGGDLTYMTNSVYGAGELVRGMKDPDGELEATFRQAMDEDRPVEWSIAAFAQPNAGRANVMMGAGSDESSHESVATQFGTGSSAVVPGETPLLLSLDHSTGLSVDGAVEVLTGGQFKVNSIEPDRVWMGNVTDEGLLYVDGMELTPEEADEYGYDQWQPVTRITLTQTKEPEPVG